MTSDMLRMALQPDEIEAAKLRASRDIDDMTPPNYTNRRAVLSGLVARWLVGGVILGNIDSGRTHWASRQRLLRADPAEYRPRRDQLPSSSIF